MKKFFLRAIIASSLIGSSLMAADLNTDAVSDINGNARAVKGYYINYTGAEWIYVDLTANNAIYWWGNDKTTQVYASVTGTATISADKKSVTFNDLSSDNTDAAATIDTADNKDFPINGYFVQTEVKDASNLPVWFYIDAATNGYWQYPNDGNAANYVEATASVTSTLDVTTGEVTPEPTPTPTSDMSLTPPGVTDIPTPF